MHPAVTASLLSLSTNLDNLAIAATLGIGGAIVPWSANLTIALLSGFSTFAAISLGANLAAVLPDGSADVVGGGLLVAIGVLACCARSAGDRAEAAHADPSPDDRKNRADREQIPRDDRDFSPYTLSLLQAWGLGVALTATNFCTGVSAGLAAVPVVLASLLSFLTSLATIGLGAYCGRNLAARLADRWLDRGAGLLLAGLGACELFAL